MSQLRIFVDGSPRFVKSPGGMVGYGSIFVLVLLFLQCLEVQVTAIERLPISVLLLAWNNPLSLNHTMHSIDSSGLFEMTSEFIICFNEINDRKVRSVSKYPVHIIGSTYNLVIVRAMQMLFAAAQFPYALFVEKDFGISIERSLVYPELKIAYDTVSTSSVDVYHLRSMEMPGEPRYARKSYSGREDKLIADNSLYVCTFAQWINNATEQWPHIFKQCGPHKVVCVSSNNCNWTNNPFMLSLKFWTENMLPAIQDMFKHHKHGRLETRVHGSPHLLEPWMDKQHYVWKDRNYTVGKGKGIFTHFEIDG